MKLKNVLFIAIAILTIGLFVACNDEVVAAKDNNVAYTQVLESNGAFEYAGTKYETLQDAIEAIDKAKGYATTTKTIKVLKDVNSDGATVPATSSITLDLNGKTLSFLTSTGVTTNGDFYVEGEGEVTFAEGVTNGTAFVVNEGGELTVTNTTINVADQYAVKAAGEGATVTFGADADVAGNIAASDEAHINLQSDSVVSGTMSTSGSGTVVQVFGTLEGNVDALNSSSIELSNSSSFTGNINVLSGASLSVGSATGETGPTIGDGSTFTVSGTNSSMTANKDATNAKLAMADRATVTVNDGGKIHITAFDNGSCTIICDDTKEAEIIEDADVDINPERITDGFFKVVQDDGQIKYFSVLKDAVVSAVATTNKKVTYVRDRYNTEGVSTNSEAIISNDLTIDMNGNSDRISITVSGGTLTVENTSSTPSTLVGILGNEGAGNITIDNVTIGLPDDDVADAVNIEGNLVSTRSTFNATVTVGTLTDGKQDGTTYKNGSKFTKAIVVAGAINLKDSTLDPADGGSEPNYNANFVLSNGSDSSQNNTTIAAITMNGVKFDYSADNSDVITKYAGVCAAKGGSVSMTNSTGTAYKIIATSNSNSLGTITIDNSAMTTGSFTVKDEVAARVTISNTDYYGDVTIKGYVAATPAVSVDIIDAKNITVSYVTITDTQGQSGTRAKNGGDIASDNSVFESVVEASGNLTDGAKATTITGSTFKNAIRVTGTSSFYKSTFDPSNDGSEFYASTVAIEEGVFSTNSEGGSTGKLYNIEAKKTETESSDNVSADNLKITASTGFVGNLITSGNTSNTVNELAEIYHYYSNIVVDNSSFTAESPAKTLSVGDVSSTYTGSTAAYGNVTIKGGTTANTVTVSRISLADDVKTSYAVVTGDIGSTGTSVATVSDGCTDSSAVAGYSTFKGNIYASGAGTFNNSTFAAGTSSGKSLNAGTLVINNSVFKDDSSNNKYYALEATGADFSSTSALYINTSTGKVASLTANGGGSINVANSGAAASLTVTGNVIASQTVNTTTTYYDVTLVGNANVTGDTPVVKNVVVNGTIYGNDIRLTQTTVKDNVTAHDNSGVGSVTATNSTFTPSASGKKVSGSRLSFTTSTFTDQTNVYALEATGADYSSTSALKITNSTGKVASLTATAGSINVANGSASAALTVTGNVLAGVASTTTYYNVTLDGKNGANVIVNGTIDGSDLSLTRVTANEAVTAHAAGDIASNYSTFNSTVYAYSSITDGTNATDASGSTFKGNITAVSDGSFYGSTFKPATAADKTLSANTLVIVGATFNSNSVNVYNLQATAAYSSESYAISISSSNGSIGTVSASNAGNISIVSTTGVISNISLSATTSSTTAPSVGSIVINNSAFSEASTSAKTLSTGTISAWYAYKPTGETPTYSYVYGDVTVKGGTTTNTVTVSSISLANNVKTSYAVVTGDIGSDTTKVKTVSDGWTDSSTVAGYSTFKGNIYASEAGTFNDSTFSASESDKTLTAGKVTINSGVFEKDNSDNRYYVVGSSSSYVDGVTINDSTGYLGAVTSYYGISINNDEATDNLFINSGSGVHALKANGYNIYITGPNASGKKVDIVGKISGINIYMYAGGTGYANDGSIVVHEVAYEEFYATDSVNIYGGTYGVGGSVLFSGDTLYDIKIHKGVFYVNNSDDSLKQVAEHIHPETSYKVNIVLGGDIQLGSTLDIGIYGGVRLNYNKEITFSSIDNVARTIRVYTKYNTVASPVSDTYYDCYPVNLYSGEVVFDHVSLDYNTETSTQDTSISSNDLVVLNYCDSIYGSYEFVDANIRRGTAVGGLNP